MRQFHHLPRRAFALALFAGLVTAARAQPPGAPPDKGEQPKGAVPQLPPTILRDAVSPIDLVTALKLAGAENPELARAAAAQGIEVVEGCTLVMLRTGEF